MHLSADISSWITIKKNLHQGIQVSLFSIARWLLFLSFPFPFLFNIAICCYSKLPADLFLIPFFAILNWCVHSSRAAVDLKLFTSFVISLKLLHLWIAGILMHDYPISSGESSGPCEIAADMEKVLYVSDYISAFPLKSKCLVEQNHTSAGLLLHCNNHLSGNFTPNDE